MERRHVFVPRIDYIGKESNNLDVTVITSLTGDDYTLYEKTINNPEFREWILTLKPKDVRDEGISEIGLKNIKLKLRPGKKLKNKSKIVKILIPLYKTRIHLEVNQYFLKWINKTTRFKRLCIFPPK